MTPVKTLSLIYVCALLLKSTFSFSQGADPVVNAGLPMSDLEKHIHAVCQHVVDQNKTTDKLSPEDMADLPIGLVRQIGNGIYVIAVDSAYWDGKGWFFSAYASIKFPGASRPIAFRAQHVGFNKNGLASLTQTKLVLAAAQWITISDDLVLELPADGRNYIDFDCAGFKSINLKGNFHFTGKLIVPAHSIAKDDKTDASKKDAGTNTLAPNVTASFEVNTTDLSNVMATVNITPFKIRGMDDISFEVKNAVVDYSDFVNPVGFSFPSGYQQPFGDSPSLWRGFFLQELKIEIGGVSGKDNKPLTLQGQNMIIDDLGISGSVTASNLLSLQHGSADGWPLSINSLSVKFLQNSLSGGSIAGNMVVPLLGKDSLGYKAEMEQVEHKINYKFVLATLAEKEYATPFSSSIKLLPGSSITLERKDGIFKPSALLNGTITVKNDKMESSGIKFQNLGLTTRHPYIISGDFATVGSSQSKGVGFPIRIDSITMKVSNGQVGLGFSVGLNFMDSDSRGISAKTHINIMAKLVTDSSVSEAPHQHWKYDGIKISDISLSCNTTALTLKGRLTVFDDDPKFGNGFRGSLSLSIKKVLEKGISVNAYFGRKNSFRYWHLDASVTGFQIPLVPPLSINGFMGGVSYKMSRSKPFAPDFSKLTKDAQPTTNNNSVQGNTSGGENEFVPDSTAGFAVMAGVTLIAGNDKAFNGDAILEVAFNNDGGFRYVLFKGTGYFLNSMETRERPKDGPKKVPAPVFADMNVIYDHNNNVFHANLQVYLNLKDNVRGIGPNNLMGEAVIHVDANDWYIYIGRPSQMLGVNLAELAVAQGYFMAGTKLEDMPLPLPEVRRIAGERDMTLVKDQTTMAMGRGFAMGARFEAGFDSGDKLRPFYVALTAGAGADVMIRDFGEATCSGSTGSIGFDGWYASGQAYVFLSGKVGIKVSGHKFDFLSLGAAALLQAKLPNPTWLKGQLAGNYSVLGGLVSGKFTTTVIMGHECEIVTPGSELGNVLVIADVTPNAGSNDVSVFTSPQVSFNTSVDSELSMLNNQDQLNSYRVKLDEFSLTNNGQPVTTSYEWNGKKDVLALRLSEVLPPRASLKAFVKLHWEKKLTNGSWEPLKVNNAVEYETKEATFNTGEAPDFIPDENVSYSYPIKRQYNFLSNEYGQGYVKLRYGQSYLFQASDESTKWNYLARFEQPSGNKIDMPLNYNSSESTVHFAIPTDLSKEIVYKLTFVKRPEASNSVDANLKRATVNQNGGAEGNEVKVASNTLDGNITQRIEKNIYNSAFRTSKFGTFNEKWSSLSAQQDLFDVAISNVAVIGKSATLSETFDNFELRDFPQHNKALIQVSASSGNNWMTNTMGPLLYDSYPVDPSVTITYRKTDSLGLKPLRAVWMYNMQENYTLTDTNISSGVAITKTGSVKILYYLSYFSFEDYSELRNKAAAYLTNNKSNTNISSGLSRLLRASGYTDLIAGPYPVDIRYSLPGINQVTTQKQIIIQF